MNRMTPPDRRASGRADRGNGGRHEMIAAASQHTSVQAADRSAKAPSDIRQNETAYEGRRHDASDGRRTAVKRRGGLHDRSARDTRIVSTGDRRESARNNHQRNDVKKARLELVFIGVAAVAVIAILAVLVTFVVRSLKKSGDEVPDTANSVLQSETAPVTDAEIIVEPESEAEPSYLVEYAARTAATRILTDNEISSPHAIMIDLATNTVIMDRDGDARIYPASMTKMMTLIVVCERFDNLEDTFTMTEEIVGKMWREGATVAGFDVGEKVRLDDLLYGLILPSGGDCALALAEYTAGSEEAFAKLMNEKVAALGLKGTHFTNPSGLHDDAQYSTCHDMALILEYALHDDFMKKVLTTYEYTTHPTEEHPDGIRLSATAQDRLKGDEAPGMYICGGKTGYTNEAKNCLATYAVRYDSAVDTDESAKKKAPEYIFVTAEADGKYTPIFDAINAYALILDENAMETKYR